MGTREWTLSTFVGCCIWILHGLGAAAVPVTTEGPFAEGTASPVTEESEREWPGALMMGTVETTTAAADAVTAESILAGSLSSSTSSPGVELNSLVTVTSEYGTAAPALTNVTKPPNTSQDIERDSVAPAAATTAPAISTQHLTVTPEADLDIIGATPNSPLGTTPFFADVKEDILRAVTREGTEDLGLTTSSVSLPTTLPLTAAWVAEPTAVSPMGDSVTVLPRQELTTAMGAAEEGVTLPVNIQSDASANFLNPSPELLTTQQDGEVRSAVSITTEPTRERAAVESPLDSVSEKVGNTVNNELSTATSSHLPLESLTVSGTVGNPEEHLLLPGQAALSPAASLAPNESGDENGWGAPGVSSEPPASAVSPAVSEAPEAPKAAEDTGTSLLAPKASTEAQSGTDLLVPGTALPRGDMGAVRLARPSLQPTSWQIPTGEQLLPSPRDIPSAPEAIYPPSEAGTNTLPAMDGTETPASPDLGAAPGAPVSPPLERSQPRGTAAGASQGVNGPGTDLSSTSDTSNPSSLAPEGLAWPTAGVQGQGAQGAGDTAQAEGPGNGNLYADTQGATSPSAISAQQDPSNTGELPAGETGALVNAELSPPSAPGDGAEAEWGLEQVSPPGPPPPNGAGLEPDLLGPGEPENLPVESVSAPGAAYPPSEAVSGAETPASPDLSAAPGAPVSPSLEGSQPWGTSVGASQGVSGPGTDLNSASDTSSTSSLVPEGLAWPTAEVQGQGAQGAWDGNPYADTQGATSPSAISAQQDPSNTGELPAGETGALVNAELSPPSAPGDGAEAEWGLEQVSPPGPPPPNGAGLEPDLLGPGEPENLPVESVSAPGAAYPPSEAVSGAETPASPDLSAAPGAPVSPSLEGSQLWGTVVGASQGVNGPGTDLNSASDTSNPSSLVPEGLAWPTAEVQGQGAQGAQGAGDIAQAEGPGNGNPGAAIQSDTNLSAISTQQDPSNTGELPAGGAGALVNAELSPPSVPGVGTEAISELGQLSPPHPAHPSAAGLQADLSGPGEPGNLPVESARAPGAAYPPSGAVSGVETPASPDLSAAPGASIPLTLEGSQPWGTAAGAHQGAGLPEASEPGSGSAASGPAGAPSFVLGDQLGSNLGSSAAEGHGDSHTEQALGGAGPRIRFEPSLSSITGNGIAAGMDELPGAGSSSGAASPSGVVASPSLSNPDSLSTLTGGGSAPGALQPSLDVGPRIFPTAGEGAGEVPGDGGSLGQSQATAGQGVPVSGTLDGHRGVVLQSVSSSTSTERSPPSGTVGDTTDGVSGAGSGLSTSLEAAAPEQSPVPAPGIQSGASLGLSDAKLSQVSVVDVPGGAPVNGGPSRVASLGESTGDIIQISSGTNVNTSSQEMQPVVSVAPDGSSISDSTASSLAVPQPLPGHGMSSGLESNGSSHSSPSSQSGSRSLVLGAPGGLAGDAGGAQTWSLEDEVASGMPTPSGDTFPHIPMSPNAAPALPSAPQRDTTAVGTSASPGLPALFSARESSAEGRGELGAAMLREPTLPLAPHQPGSPGVPFGGTDSPVPGEVSAVLPGAIARRGDMVQLLPSTTGTRTSGETPSGSLLGGDSGLPGLPATEITAGSSESKTSGPRPAGGLSPTALQPFLGRELTTLPKGAPSTDGASTTTAFLGQRGAQGKPPTTARPAVSCSPGLSARLPGVREVFTRPGAATAISHSSSPLFPAPPREPMATPTPLPGPTAAAVPLYRYGVRENDREYVERRVDFNSPLFKPETGFPFGKTLRDSLYFTDNGQIIFPASDNSIFTYPNPPPSGFNGHEEVPMIAVFWDNADFSRGVGTTFYQEFLTLNTAKPPFVRDVEEKIRRYLKSSYSAVWTLKITWEKAPAYTARTDTRRTITYQAILTTDGFRSYILMLYQDGGMQWDYTRLAANNVLIGYTSGDGFYRNDDLSKRPPAVKYRPDQFRGYNTDLRGLWIYKLESRMGVNYRLKCLAWTGQQEEPRMWSQGLPACPCSLQQGQQDPRFKSSHRGWWAARVSMLHSAAPNQHGASVRCLYDSQGQLIEGRQERYWRSSRQASPYRDQELKLYDWCCNQAGSAHLCARYSEKRPKIGCDGYQSPDKAGSSEVDSDSEEQKDGEDE